MKKIKDRIIRLVLIAMILLSLYLSMKIWTQSSATQGKHLSSDISTSAIIGREERDVFVPTKMVYHDREGRLLFTNQESVINDVVTEYLKYDLTNLKQTNVNTREEYLSLLKSKSTVELIFSARITMSYYFSIHDSNFRGDFKDNTKFNRVLIDYKGRTFSFLNDKTYEVFTATFNDSLSPLMAVLEEDNNRFQEVELIDELDPILYGFKEEVKLKKYSYILETQSYTVFSKLLFNSTQDVFSSDNVNKDIRLRNYEGQSLTLSNASGALTFEDPLTEEEKSGMDEWSVFDTTFRYVRKIGKNVGNVRYFDRIGDRVVYRKFVEGYPVFSDYDRGRMEIAVESDEIVLSTNQNTIQVPIPSEEEVTLPKTQDVLAELKRLGMEPEDIQGIQVGYTWEENDENKQIVNLEPSWYIKYADEWGTISEVIDYMKENNKEEEQD